MYKFKLTVCLLALCFMFCLGQGPIAPYPSLKEFKKLQDIVSKLTDEVKQLNEKVKFLTSRFDRYEQLNDKNIYGIGKSTKKEITEMQNALKKCCGTYKPKERTLTITADDEAYLYLDGEEISLTHYKDWDVPDIVLLPKETKIIAVKGVNFNADAGIIASTDDGYVITNSSWKCTSKKSTEWKNADFDDSDWPPASYARAFYEKPIEGIRYDAHWIWTDRFSGRESDKNVFCRLTLKKSKTSG